MSVSRLAPINIHWLVLSQPLKEILIRLVVADIPKLCAQRPPESQIFICKLLRVNFDHSWLRLHGV